MAPPPLLSLRDVFATFGGTPLFRGVTVSVGRGDRTCLIGRNGSGKSTLLKTLAGLVAIDGGERFIAPGLRIAYLSQDPVPAGGTVSAYVAEGLPPASSDAAHQVAAVLDGLSLEGDRLTETLSGGEGRRAGLARALVGDPDVLFLDEPTNHLDLPTIRWLEEQLAAFRGGLVAVSHDRAFLESVSQRTWWLERGVVRIADHGFAGFESWRDAIVAEEEKNLSRIDTKLAAEAHWLHRGVTARRSRNQGRLRKLWELRQVRAEMVRRDGGLKLAADSGGQSGRLVIEARDISFAHPGTSGDIPVVDNFSTRILRGDRIGFIGPNGAGKTTLLRLLIGDLAPNSGLVRLGTGLVPAYFDQHRTALDPNLSLIRTLADGGGEYINVRGQMRHIVGYLRDFLFDERQTYAPVSTLSGGERNRLLLAKQLAIPSNLLVMDEPTNDLDMDTLDLLLEALDDYDGTLLLVSHDRDFLDRVATSIIAVEGDGEVEEYVGGYSDYLTQRKPTTAKKASAMAAPRLSRVERPRAVRKLSYRDQRELDELPKRIDAFRAEMKMLHSLMDDGGFYARDPAGFSAATNRLHAAEAALAADEERWLELEMQREALQP